MAREQGLEEELLQSIRTSIAYQSEKLPDKIRLKDVRKIYEKLKPEKTTLMDFLDLFQRCTGYLLKGGKLEKVIRYRDPTLRSVAYDVYKSGISVSPAQGFLRYGDRDFIRHRIPHSDVFDYRLMIAYMVMSTLFFGLPFKLPRKPDGLPARVLAHRIAQNIPSSLRWETPALRGPEDLGTTGFSGTCDEFELMNIAESRAIGVIAWHASRGKKKRDIEDAFSDF